MANRPLLSVLMTSFNREHLIDESIQSVLNSSFKDYELIIVDDASTDNTWMKILDFAKSDSRIKPFKNETNLGDYRNRNKAASYAEGKYLKYIDSDDLISTDCLAVMVYHMEKYPNTSIGLASNYKKIMQLNEKCLSPVDLYRQFFFYGNLLNCGPSKLIFRTNVFKEYGGFNLNSYLSDTDLILKISSNYEALVFHDELVFWRRHFDQEYNYAQKSNYYKDNRYKLLINYLESKYCPLHSVEKNMAVRNLKNRYARSIIFDLLKGKLKRVFLYTKMYDISFIDFVFSIFPNQYPKYNGI
jgi:glycosyltransferase involved in cell wall biosynthesis